MLKKFVIALMLAVSFLLLTSCSKEENTAQTHIANREVLDIGEYMSGLSPEKTAQLKTHTDLLLHPLKDAIARYGKDYAFSWEGNYVKLTFKEAKCSVDAYVGAEFEHYDWYNNFINFDDCNVMEYLSFAVIERVIFDGEGMTLTDGISIGMSARQIAETLNVAGIDYSKFGAVITAEYDSNGKEVNVYSTSGTVLGVDYIVAFAGDRLSRVEIANYSGYLVDGNADTDNGKQRINEAFSFVTEKSLATFDAVDLSYKGERYSPYYDSWFYGWQFTQGNYEGYVINVEQNDPYRIYVASAADAQPILFWSNGKYVDPMLSFLGKWRDYNTKEYIDIKSISKEGIVVFDMYTDVGINTGEMVLLENINTAINDIPKNLAAYLRAECADEWLDGDVQLFNGDVQSGYYTYGGVRYYLIDSFFMKLNGSVQYLPRSLTGRVGAGPLPIHIPNENCEYTQPSTWGYMENFGRDDLNRDNILLTNTPAGDFVINRYLNALYETSGLKYADREYSYLYDYVFPVNDVTYNVWQSNDTELSHYLYVDSVNELIIKECQFNLVSRHSKELIYKDNVMVGGRSYANQKYVTLDGTITVDLANRSITKAGAFVERIDLLDVGLDTVGKNERFMFFSDIGNRFALNGYILFDHTTWGATLHITDSNVPDFDIGVYYLNSETFFLDPSVSVVGVLEGDTDDSNLDDRVDETGTDTKLIIREYGGRIIGYIYVDESGKKTVKDYYGKILGYYYPDRDVTTDYLGKIIARGDVASALLFSE